jgi:hypothetical protein
MCGIAQMSLGSVVILRPMKKPATPTIDKLHAAHAKAVLDFNAAAAVLILHVAAGSVPTAKEIATEEKRRAAVVAARRKIWPVPPSREDR